MPMVNNINFCAMQEPGDFAPKTQEHLMGVPSDQTPNPREKAAWPGETQTDCQEEAERLTLGLYVEDRLRQQVDGLLHAEGSPDRVSSAMACFAAYASMNLRYIPVRGDCMLYLIETLAPILQRSQLDADEVDWNWPVIKGRMSVLAEMPSLPSAAKKEAKEINQMLFYFQQGNDSQKLQTIQFVVSWLRNYWQYVCEEYAAYEALRSVCVCLKNAPTDWKTRASLVGVIDRFAQQLSQHSRYHREMYKRAVAGSDCYTPQETGGCKEEIS